MCDVTNSGINGKKDNQRGYSSIETPKNGWGLRAEIAHVLEVRKEMGGDYAREI